MRAMIIAVVSECIIPWSSIIEDLKENGQDIGVGLFNLVQEDNSLGLFFNFLVKIPLSS